MPISRSVIDGILDLRPIGDGERAEVRRGLGPMAEVEAPSPVARVQRGQLPADIGLWRGYYERMWMRPGSLLGIHRLPDLYGGLYLLIERQAADGTIARCRLQAFGGRHRLGFLPACDGQGGLSVMLPLAAVASTLGVPAEALNDRMLPLEDLWGPAGRLLEERLAICRDDVDRMAIFNRVLRRLLARNADRRLFAAARAIEGSSGTLRIDALAGSLGLGRRSLERLFAGTFGIGPKRYARAVRLQQALGRLIGTPAPQVDWTSLALDVGCYDQSHLIHEFQDFTGMGPSDFAAIPGIGFTLAFGAVLMPRPGGSWRDRTA